MVGGEVPVTSGQEGQGPVLGRISLALAPGSISLFQAFRMRGLRYAIKSHLVPSISAASPPDGRAMTARSKSSTSRIRKVTVTVAKGLSKKDGLSAVWNAAKRKGKNDARAMGYDPKAVKGWAL